MKEGKFQLRRSTVEQLISLLRDGRYDEWPAKGEDRMKMDRRKAVADNLEEQISRADAIALCGLPGAGKSYVADQLADVYDAPVVSMGDAIREQYESEHGGDYTSDDLGNFAAQWRDDDAEAIPKRVTDIAYRYYDGVGEYAEEQSDLIIIDGVRSVTDHEVLSEFFDRFYLIEVESPFYTRLERLTGRGREGEEDFTAVDLAKRDERERQELGYGDLIESERPDVHLSNSRGELLLRSNLASIVYNNLPFDLEDESKLLPPVGGHTMSL